MADEKVFTVSAKVDSAKDCETFASMAAQLKKHGRVEVGISSVSGKAWYDIPKGGSPWHEYTSYQSTLLKFFPHPKIAPFLDAKCVRSNRQLLRSCVRVLRKHRLDAAFDSHEPYYISEKFFARHPHLRGARVDHPRRSLQEAHALCVDRPESREMLAWMMKRLVKEAPELTYLAMHTNDAGSGMCWSDYTYSGPNGPAHCHATNTGERVASLFEAMRNGAGKKLDISVEGMFSQAERNLIPHHLDENSYLTGRGTEPCIIRTGTLTDNPVQGLFDPASILRTLARTRDPRVKRIRVGFRNNYSRSHNDPETAAKVIELIGAFFAKPACGRLDRINLLADLCAKWAGKSRAADLFDAFMAMHEALTFKAALTDSFYTSANYVGVSMRLINRPLVAIPEKLTPQEEAYFLPHVFNVREAEARTDYLDVHGARIHTPINPARPSVRMSNVDRLCSMMNRAAASFEELKGGRSMNVFRRMGTSLRIYSCIVRSIHNFACMQILRERNKEKLYAPEPLTPPKVNNWTGDPDLLQINDIMRDELDNTDTFIDILSRPRARRQLALATTQALEDTFLLGPNFPDTLKRKRRIMRRHWLDAEQVMASPMK